MWPLDDIGATLGEQVKSMVASAFEAAMTAIWDASLDLLRTALQLADQFSVFSVSTTEGPLKVVWPMMLWISGVLALGLFSWQLIVGSSQGKDRSRHQPIFNGDFRCSGGYGLSVLGFDRGLNHESRHLIRAAETHSMIH